MFKSLGLEKRRDGLLFLAIVTLVAVTPLGKEATNPIVLVLYRLLLIAISALSIAELREKGRLEVSPGFVGLCALVPLLMLISLQWNAGSRFDGFYHWYQFLLFGFAFIALAGVNRTRSDTWKKTILWAIITIDICYVALDVVIGARPLTFPFINPNYFGSFLLAGFAAAVAIAFFERGKTARLSAAVSALILFYGITQTWSRGAALAALSVVVLAFIRFSVDHPHSRRIIALLAIAAVFAGAAASPVLIRKFMDRGQTDPYNYQRPQIWLSATRVISGHPLLGVGLGQFFHISKQFSPAVDAAIGRYMKRPGIAHSEYLQIAAESGIPAAILLFSLAGYLVLLAIRRSHTRAADQLVFFQAALLGAAGLGIHALVDNNWDVPVMASGLILFATADVLPLRRFSLPVPWSPRIRIALALALVLVVIDGIVVPGIALYFNEAGHEAFVAGEIDKAESLHRLAVAMAPQHDVFLDNAALVYQEKYVRTHDGKWLDLEEQFLTDAMQANPNSEDAAHHMEAVLIQRLTGDVRKDLLVHARIIETERHVLKIVPFYPFARLNLAEALFYSGRRDEAEHELVRAVEYEPNYVGAYLLLAEWRQQAGDAAGSEDYRRTAIAVVTRYQQVETKEPYEALLLGRPDPRQGLAQSNP